MGGTEIPLLMGSGMYLFLYLMEQAPVLQLMLDLLFLQQVNFLLFIVPNGFKLT